MRARRCESIPPRALTSRVHRCCPHLIARRTSSALTFHRPALALPCMLCNTDLSAAMVRYYLVKGRVQGVGFRWFVHREAAALQLRGWVRNTESGHVEVVAAGEESELKRLQALLAKGSRGSRGGGI